MDAIAALRDFFDRQLSVTDEVRGYLGVDHTVSRRHLIHHLVERTIRRASTDAATQRTLGPENASVPSDAGGLSDTGVSWKHCLMVAALIELRPLRLAARGSV